MTPEMRQKHRDDFILSYYNQFVASLKSFGYLKAPPTLIDLKVELLKNGPFEVILAIAMSIFYFIDFSDFSDMKPEDMTPEKQKKWREDVYSNPEFLDMMLKEMPRFLYNGFMWKYEQAAGFLGSFLGIFFNFFFVISVKIFQIC